MSTGASKNTQRISSEVVEVNQEYQSEPIVYDGIPNLRIFGTESCGGTCCSLYASILNEDEANWHAVCINPYSLLVIDSRCSPRCCQELASIAVFGWPRKEGDRQKLKSFPISIFSSSFFLHPPSTQPLTSHTHILHLFFITPLSFVCLLH